MVDVPTLIPLHSRTMTVVRASTAKTRVRKKNANRTRHVGNLAFADFQLTPPFGNSILSNSDRIVGSSLAVSDAQLNNSQ